MKFVSLAIALLAGMIGCAVAYSTADAAKSEYDIVHTFGHGSDGQFPYLTFIDVKGTLYGTTSYGGAYGEGTVFALDPKTRAETVLHSFGEDSSDGSLPYAGLIDVKGTLYGVTNAGGTYGHGTAFSLDPHTGAEAVLHSFGNGSDGQVPYANLIDVKGTLYGVTGYGGGIRHGTVFSLAPNTGVETVLHSFGIGTDGSEPLAGLIDVKGTLYGTTVFGGANKCGLGTCGIVFALDLSTGTETVVHSFAPGDGYNPTANMIDVHGTLYGTTAGGGAYSLGTVFALDPGTGTETVLYSFRGGSDGSDPYAGLINVKGTLYGTTELGGTNSFGTVFALDLSSGAETVLHSFGSDQADGSQPWFGLTDVKGTLYGTTTYGGAYGTGTVFALKP